MQADVSRRTASGAAAEVKQLRVLMARNDFTRALSDALALRDQIPDDRDVLYIIAVCLRYLKRTAEALTALTELERHHPNYARLFQERGHCYLTLRSALPAVEAFKRAVELNSCLPASWRALANLYRLLGRDTDERAAIAEIDKLVALPAPIVSAFSMYADGEIHEAETAIRRYLLEHGDHVEAMRLLAKIGMDLDVVDDAELLLENVVCMEPSYHAARYEYALALLKRHKHRQAREQMQKLLALEPDNPIYRTTLATIDTGFGHYDLALPLYRTLAAESPHEAELQLSIGHAEKTLGHQNEAIEAYRAATLIRPQFGEAFWSLANLKTYRFSDVEIDRMNQAEQASNIPLVDRYHLCFALGKALEDRGEYARSFAYYERGNELKKNDCRYRAEPLERNAAQQSVICTRDFFEARRGFGSQSSAPIFIVGLPRSGSTLIEQILASHSRVEGTMELADIPRTVQELQGREVADGVPRYPGVMGEMSADEFTHMGEKYLSDTLVYRRGKPHFIDKMPNNFRHISLIHLMLPNAKIIDARREPMACCFSNYKQLFASGQQFTYSIDDISRYYRMYMRLMEHWDRALPGKILRVQHEDLIDDIDTQVRRILEFCSLEFEPGCIEFHKTRRTVHTASSEQVRRPINRDGVDQWRHFEPWLETLKEALSSMESRAS